MEAREITKTKNATVVTFEMDEGDIDALRRIRNEIGVVMAIKVLRWRIPVGLKEAMEFIGTI